MICGEEWGQQVDEQTSCSDFSRRRTKDVLSLGSNKNSNNENKLDKYKKQKVSRFALLFY